MVGGNFLNDCSGSQKQFGAGTLQKVIQAVLEHTNDTDIAWWEMGNKLNR
jgi:hypothetical protein